MSTMEHPTMQSNELEGTLKTLDPSGQPPRTRIGSAMQARSIVDRLILNDQKRSRVRELLKGLVDGNPPYSPKKLQEQGQSFRSNVNFREAEAFLASGQSSFYDVFNEAQTYALVELDTPDAQNTVEIGNVMTEEYDRFNKLDDKLDFMMQLSQRDMTLFGTGPVIWEDKLDFRATPVMAENILLPDRASCYVEDWEICVILSDYEQGRLFNWIDQEGAADAGWMIEAVKQALIDNMPTSTINTNSRGWNWESLQHALRNNDLAWSSTVSVIRVAHLFWKEFRADKKGNQISHGIILLNSNGRRADQNKDEWLFLKEYEHEDWCQLINPFYYDKGDGTHHSVKGMGIKFYGALELKNRLKNSVVDAAFARAQIMLSTDDASTAQELSIQQMGPYSIIQNGVTAVQQTAVGGVLDAPMAVDRELLSTVSSNLSQYRQNLQKDEGNPISATEATVRTQQQSILGKTQLNRYYAQLDAFWKERWRRATNTALTKDAPGGELAVEFQERMKQRGVTPAMWKKAMVKSNRVVGQGSSFLRQQVLQNMLALGGVLPEDGYANVVQDYVAATAGQSRVARYNPTEQARTYPTQQEWEANQENAILKLGSPVLWTPQQNDAVHLKLHLQAAAAAAESIQQNPQAAMDIAAFLHAELSHIPAHLQSLSRDPTQKQRVQVFEQQAKQLEQVANELTSQLQQAQKQQAANQQQMADVTHEQQIKNIELAGEEKRRDFRTMRDDARKQLKARQQMVINDLKTAQDLRLSAARNGESKGGE